MMKLLISSFLIGATVVSSGNVRGASDAPETPPPVQQVDGFPPIPKEAGAHLVPEPTRVTLLYSSMDTNFSDLMSKQVGPLIDTECGHFVKWDFVPYGQTLRTPHPWVQTEYVYEAPKGKIDLMQNVQQLCTLDAFNHTFSGWDKVACLQGLASQDGDDSRGMEWFESGDNMKTCFGMLNIKEFKEIIDCTQNNRIEALLDDAVFKTYHLGLTRDDLPKVLINYKPVDYTSAVTDLRQAICDNDVNKNWACCNRDKEKEEQEAKWFKISQIWTAYAQKTVRQAQQDGVTNLDLNKIPDDVMKTFPKELQDALRAESKEDRYITDADLEKERNKGVVKDVAQTQ